MLSSAFKQNIISENIIIIYKKKKNNKYIIFFYIIIYFYNFKILPNTAIFFADINLF